MVRRIGTANNSVACYITATRIHSESAVSASLVVLLLLSEINCDSYITKDLKPLVLEPVATC
jgi:hypothetical protein